MFRRRGPTSALAGLTPSSTRPSLVSDFPRDAHLPRPGHYITKARRREANFVAT
jgi:hypothetical protein